MRCWGKWRVVTVTVQRAAAILICAAAAASVGAADWPQWRGPHRDGVSTETVLTAWPTNGPGIVWQASVGIGFSAFAVGQNRAYTMGNTTNQDTVWCFDARTGKPIWRHTYPAQLSPQWYEGGPGATPTLDGGSVFTISKWGDVFCFNATNGSVRWQRDFRLEGIKPNRWGFAGSPLVWHDLVIFNAGAAGVALNRLTGRIVWSTGTNTTGYASPTLARYGGRECVLVFAAKHLVALDPATGRELWRHPWQTDWDTNISDPVVREDTVFISSFSHGCALLSLPAAGMENAAPTVRYETKGLFNHLSPPLLQGEFLYAFNGEAKQTNDFRCIHLPSGELKWARKDPAFGSLIAAHNALILLSEKGELLLFPTGTASAQAPEPLARAKVLTGTCWTPPALANGLLYLRNAKGEVRCLEMRRREG